MRVRLLPIALAALWLSCGGARATDGVDLAELKSLVAAGEASGGTGPALRAYAGLAKILAKANAGLPDELARLRSVAGACAGPLVADAPLRAALAIALNGGAAAVRTLDAGVLAAAGDLDIEAHRDSILAKAARARAMERLGESKRVFGADTAAAGLFRRAALGFEAALRAAERLRAREIPKNPVWAVPVQGRSGALLGVWGEPGPDPRLYVVGAEDASGPQFLVLHPAAEGWVRVPVAESGDLWWVTVVPGDGAWASGSGGRVVRYDPATGELADRSPGVNALLFGIWGSGPSDVWTVGGDPDGAGPRPALLHWDGGGWTPAAVPAEAAGHMLYKVWGTAANDVWAVGDAGLILHFDGTSWFSVPSGSGSDLLTVSGPSPLVAVGGNSSAVVLERSGDGAWTSVPVTGVSSGNGGQGGAAAVRTLVGVFVPASGAPLAVGYAGSVVRRGPAGWTGIAGLPSAVRDLHSVWIDGAGNAVMVGGRLSSLKEGIMVTYGRASLPSIITPRARFRDGLADLLHQGCAHSGCHLPPFSNAGLAFDTPGISRSGLVGVAATESPLLRVLPGRPSQSYLWHKLLGTQETVGGSGDRMPVLHLPGDATFGDADMELVRGWILDGARDN